MAVSNDNNTSMKMICSYPEHEERSVLRYYYDIKKQELISGANPIEKKNIL